MNIYDIKEEMKVLKIITRSDINTFENVLVTSWLFYHFYKAKLIKTKQVRNTEFDNFAVFVVGFDRDDTENNNFGESDNLVDKVLKDLDPEFHKFFKYSFSQLETNGIFEKFLIKEFSKKPIVPCKRYLTSFWKSLYSEMNYLKYLKNDIDLEYFPISGNEDLTVCYIEDDRFNTYSLLNMGNCYLWDSDSPDVVILPDNSTIGWEINDRTNKLNFSLLKECDFLDQDDIISIEDNKLRVRDTSLYNLKLYIQYSQE